MDRTSFDKSMERGLAFYQKPRSQDELEDFKRYMDMLYESVGSMEPFSFDQTTKELIKSLARGQKPMPGQFWAAYHKLNVEKAEAAERARQGTEWREDKETCDRRAIEMASRLGKKGAEFALMLLDAAPENLKNAVHPDALQILIDKVSEPVREAAPTMPAAVGSPAQETYEVEE